MTRDQKIKIITANGEFPYWNLKDHDDSVVVARTSMGLGLHVYDLTPDRPKEVEVDVPSDHPAWVYHTSKQEARIQAGLAMERWNEQQYEWMQSVARAYAIRAENHPQIIGIRIRIPEK